MLRIVRHKIHAADIVWRQRRRNGPDQFAIFFLDNFRTILFANFFKQPFFQLLIFQIALLSRPLFPDRRPQQPLCLPGFCFFADFLFCWRAHDSRLLFLLLRRLYLKT
ncbi:MAG: hypothetical protein V4691_10660 [Pseudomonadota bacterium]